MLTLNAQAGKRIDETLAPLIAGGSERICIIDPPGYATVGDGPAVPGVSIGIRLSPLPTLPALCYRMKNMRLVDSDQTES